MARKQAWSGWGRPMQRVAGWDFDHRLNGYITTAADRFSCDCGEEFPTPSGYRKCGSCGRAWNSYVIGTDNHGKEASLEKVIVREIPVRKDVIVASKRRRAQDKKPKSAPDTSWMGNLSKAELADMIGYPGEDTPEQRRTEREVRKGSSRHRRRTAEDDFGYAFDTPPKKRDRAELFADDEDGTLGKVSRRRQGGQWYGPIDWGGNQMNKHENYAYSDDDGRFTGPTESVVSYPPELKPGGHGTRPRVKRTRVKNPEDYPPPRGEGRHRAEARRRRAKEDGECTCWEGYERVPGTKPCAKGSCRKKAALRYVAWCRQVGRRPSPAGLRRFKVAERIVRTANPNGQYDPDWNHPDRARLNEYSGGKAEPRWSPTHDPGDYYYLGPKTQESWESELKNHGYVNVPRDRIYDTNSHWKHPENKQKVPAYPWHGWTPGQPFVSPNPQARTPQSFGQRAQSYTRFREADRHNLRRKDLAELEAEQQPEEDVSIEHFSSRRRRSGKKRDCVDCGYPADFHNAPGWNLPCKGFVPGDWDPDKDINHNDPRVKGARRRRRAELFDITDEGETKAGKGTPSKSSQMRKNPQDWPYRNKNMQWTRRSTARSRRPLG